MRAYLYFYFRLRAAHLEWHLRRALAPPLFADETPAETRRTQDPAAA